MWCNSVRSMILEYIDSGFRLLPVKRNDKKPLLSDWQRLASSDLFEIATWFHKWPTMNLGLACGASGILAIDVDKHDADGFASWRKLVDRCGSGIEETLSQWTPRDGRHFLFRSSAGLRNRTGFMPGLDSRGSGGFILIPPSVIDGKPYRWIDLQVPILDLPAPLAAILAERKRGDPEHEVITSGTITDVDQLQHWYDQAAGRARIGTRNESAFWLACQARDCGILEADVQALAWRFVADVPQDKRNPFTIAEFRNTVASAYGYSRRDPAKRQA